MYHQKKAAESPYLTKRKTLKQLKWSLIVNNIGCANGTSIPTSPLQYTSITKYTPGSRVPNYRKWVYSPSM